jgi:glycopeptide antibiotics resistance protein
MKTKHTRWVAACAFITYSAILIRFVVFKAIPTIRMGHLRFKFGGPHTGPANLVPFKTILGQLIGQGNRLIDVLNLMGNFIPFLPIGLLAPLVSQSISWQKALILGVVTGLTFEVMEVIFQVGIFDVDDVMMNAFGVVAGYGVFVMLRRRACPPT